MSEHDYHKSVKKRKSSILIIWIIPFIALFIAGSMITKYFVNQGEEIVIVFKSAEGFTIGKTLLKYKGIRVGIVSNMTVNEKATDEFLVTVTVDKSAIALVNKKGTKFWTVEPKVSMGEISGLNTIISGSYIEVLPGDEESTETQSTDFFTAEETKPIESFQDGTFLILKSKHGDLGDGSPLLYKKHTVGKVVKKDLKEGLFYYTVYVKRQYGNLIKEQSHFWGMSGIDFKASLSGLELKTGPLASVIAGGILFDSPEHSKVVKDKKHQFDLCDDKDDVLHDKRKQEGKYFYIRVADLGSISSQDPIYYKSIKAGEVVDYKYDKDSDTIDVKIFIAKDFVHLINTATRFYNQSGISLDIGRDHVKFSTQALDTVLRGGLGFIVNNKQAEAVKKHFKFSLYDSEAAANANNIFITLEMDKGFKLTKGSALYYKDIKIGSVESLRLNMTKSVTAKIGIDKKYESLLRQDTLFWLEDFKISVRGVKNSPAAIFGPALCLKPGHSTEKRSEFVLSEREPFPTYNKEGLRIIVKGSRKSSLKPGSPVLYRQLKIGSVEHYDLVKDGTSVAIGLFIEKKYAYLVRKNSQFYHASAIGMKVSLSGIKVTTETLESMLYGGIGMVTPESIEEKAGEGECFTLALEAEEEWFKWEPKLTP